jgi:hypothetical protein
MFLSKKILTSLTFMGSVNAAVLNIRNSAERRATQSCHATCHGAFASYSVWIGVPYDSQSCDDTYNSLEYNVDFRYDGCEISNWQCVRAGDGKTQLWFNAPSGFSQCLNSALEGSYLNIDGGFNCPDC